jgi:hypothetical protein
MSEYEENEILRIRLREMQKETDNLDQKIIVMIEEINCLRAVLLDEAFDNIRDSYPSWVMAEGYYNARTGQETNN